MKGESIPMIVLLRQQIVFENKIQAIQAHSYFCPKYFLYFWDLIGFSISVYGLPEAQFSNFAHQYQFFSP